MSPSQYVRAVLRRWWVVVSLVLVGVAVGFGSTRLIVPTYTSTATVLIAPTADATLSSAEAYQAALLADARSDSYADLATSDAVLGQVIDEIGIDVPVAELAPRVQVTVPANTTVLRVGVTDDDPQVAQQLAQATSDRLVTVITRAERRRGGPAAALLRADAEGPASLPASADVMPPAWRNPALGGGAGLLVGLAAAVVMYRTDRRLRDDDAVSQTLRRPVVGELRTGRRRQSGMESEAFRAAVQALRTNIFFHHPDHPRGCLRLALTAPHTVPDLPRIAVMLAESLRDTGRRVLLIEGDMREPRVDALMGLGTDASTGLGPQLDGTGARDVAQHVDRSGIDIVPAGKTSRDTAGLLHSQQFADFLADAGQRYDFIVVTSPPTADGTDAAAIAAQCDTTAVLVRRHVTRTEQLEAAARQLAGVGAGVIGAVVLG